MWLSIEGDGPLVVKLGGIAAGVRLFREEIGHAVAAGFRVAAVETTGERHDDPAAGPLTWDGMSGEVAAAIARAGGGPAVLWGTSFGSVLALATAARHPERVAGLVLCCPPDPLWRPAAYRRLQDWVERRRRPDRMSAWVMRILFAALAGWEFLYPPLMVRAPGMFREVVSARTPGSTLRQRLSLLLTDDPGLPPAAPPIPVSLIVGAWDLIAPPSRALLLARRIPGSVCRVMERCGHWGCKARPRTYRRIALEELRRVAGRRGT